MKLGTKLELLGEKYEINIWHEMLTIQNRSAERMSINDRKRIIRAIEIFEITGKTMTEFNKNFREPLEEYNLVMIGLNMNEREII